VSPTQIHEGANANYTVTASAAVSQSINVKYAMSGTATFKNDYTLSTGTTPLQVTIPAGQSSATVTLRARTDNTAEQTETATMTLQPGTGYVVGPNNQKTVSILDGP
jgi:hypothetical protein